ncbi:MAG: TlpA family protein disulfide reductase [Candidatus Cloacimonetes bacterium]|nr:TlpA family protein disulfide reductase [Candidatus Cloacimonadota bacterium]
MKNIFAILLIAFMVIQLTAVDKAGDFKLENLEGKQVKLSDFQKEGLVILDFWATWCVPCKNGLPKLNELHEKYDSVNVIAINTDKPRKKSAAVSHIKSNKFKFQTLFDPKKVVQKQFNITSIPHTIIIDPDGTIIYDHTGYQRGDEKHYEEVIIKWLEEQNATEPAEDALEQQVIEQPEVPEN